MDDTVHICREEYNDLLACEKLLRALEAAGIKDWEGYEDALDLMEK